MNPFVNAMLGVLFIGAGVTATVAMYYLRGSVARREPRAKAPEVAGTIGEAGDKEYLATWKRLGDDLEHSLDDIHTIAATGKSIIEPMRTRKKVVGWDDLLIKAAQLHKFPLNEEENVRTETVIGPASDHPLVIETPVYVSHMSFGALSREIKIALARGSAAVGTAICSGEGGILEDELRDAHKYIFEFVPNQYSASDENLRRVDAVEIKIGQSAKPGMGGYLPGNKVTWEIAAVRGRPEGRAITSPAHFNDIQTQDDLRRLVDSLRERSGGKPIGIKIAAGNVEDDLAWVLHAGPDFVTVDGRAGATGAAPKFVKDSTSIPTVFALYRARKFLNEVDAPNISLVVTGGLRISSDFVKALALGADAVAIATAALIAGGCQQYRICHTGNCPVGITSQSPELREHLEIDKSAQRLANFLHVSTQELATFSRLTGNDDLHGISICDLCTTNSEISRHTEIEHV